MKKKILLSLFATINLYILLSAQTLDKNFASTNGPVYATVVQGDSVYIGGNFTQVGLGKKGLARFKKGSAKPDNFPELKPNSVVKCIEPDGEGGYYLCGDFNDYNGREIERTGVIHINANGVLDSNFTSVKSLYIYVIRKVGERLYIGGGFTTINEIPRTYIAALNAKTGRLENWTSDPLNNYVLNLYADESYVYVSGTFTYVGTTPMYQGFATLNAGNGKLVKTFPAFYGAVSAIEKDGNSLYFGGNIFTFGLKKQGLGSAKATNAKLNSQFPSVDGTVLCLISDKKGGYYIGGYFNNVGDLSRPSIAHLMADGTVDPNFYAYVNGSVYALEIDNNYLYLGGIFNLVNGTSRNNIASVSLTTGALTNFNPNIDGAVNTLARYNDTIFVGGIFATVQGKRRNYAAAVTIQNKVKAWVPNPDGPVNKIILNNAGTSAFLAGSFHTVNDKNLSFIAKVNTSNGMPDSLWKVDVNNTITSMVFDKNLLYIKGRFTAINGENRQSLAAIDATSFSLTNFKADINTDAYSGAFNQLAVNNNWLYVGGDFLKLQNSSRSNIARINTLTGKVDNWNANDSIKPNNVVFAVYADSINVVFGGSFDFLKTEYREHLAEIKINDGNFSLSPWHPKISYTQHSGIKDIIHYKHDVFISGDFTYDTSESENGSHVYCHNILSLNEINGKISHQFFEYPLEEPTKLCIYDNKLMLAGGFTHFYKLDHSDAVERYYLAGYNLSDFRLSPDEFNPNYPVTIAAGNPGNLLIGGNFTLVNFVNRNNLASININTGLVTSWNPSTNAEVYSLAIKDSVLFAGGPFTIIDTFIIDNPYLAAISTLTGRLYPFWNAGLNGPVNTIALENNTLYVGGLFTGAKGEVRKYAAAFSVSNAALKPWNPNPDYFVAAILPLNNYVYIGGNFTNVNSVSCPYLAKVDNKSGALTTWRPKVNNTVSQISSSGRNIFVSGNFTQIGLRTKLSLAAFDSSTNKLSGFNPKINGNSLALATQINTFTFYGKHVYFGAGQNFKSIGSSERGYLTGVDTTTNKAIPFNPQPDFHFYNFLFEGSMAVAQNRLFVGGAWNTTMTSISPSYFSVYKLAPLREEYNGNSSVLYSSKTIDDSPLKSAILYPNPAHNNCTITFIGKGSEAYIINVIDVEGKTVLQKSHAANKGVNTVLLNTSRFANGNYIIKITSKNGASESLKLVKQ